MAPARQLMTLTDVAAARVKAIMAAKQGEAKGLKIGVENGGCAGMSYVLRYVSGPEAGDEIFETDGITLYIDQKALLFLLGTQMDYQESELSSGFTFNNPNQLSACGCGESVALQAVPAEVLREALL